MISEQKFRVETPYGVKIFQNFHFQKHAPSILKTLAKKNFKNDKKWPKKLNIDNVIMIFAGDLIDVKIGCYMGISIMAAAAMGNMVADIAGLSLAGYIETYSSKLKIVQTNLTSHQYTFTSVKLAKYGGCIVGVVIGCTIGMLCEKWSDRQIDIE